MKTILTGFAVVLALLAASGEYFGFGPRVAIKGQYHCPIVESTSYSITYQCEETRTTWGMAKVKKLNESYPNRMPVKVGDELSCEKTQKRRLFSRSLIEGSRHYIRCARYDTRTTTRLGTDQSRA